MKPSPWMHSEADRAYFDRISFYAPMARYRRGLFRQNLFLRPDGPISPGLIPAKSLSTPRCPVVAGAYSGKISFCAPMVRYRQGLFWQNPFLRPDGPISSGLILTKSLSTPGWFDIDGAYFGKISFYAPMPRRSRGLFWQNLFLRPEDPSQTGRILAKSLSKPRCPVVAGAYSGKISFYAPLAQYPRGLF